MDIVVRPIQLTDHDGPAGLRALRAAVAAELALERGGVLFLAEQAHRTYEAFQGPAADVLCEVAIANGALVGWSYTVVRTLADGSSLATIEELAVDAGAREIGAGEALLDSALRWCRSQGCTGADSYALPGARETKNFFETFGMKARLLTVHVDLD